MKVKNKPLQFLLTLILIFVVCVGYAVVTPQPPQPLAPQGPPAAPIDGGIAVLLVAGAAYGIKKIKSRVDN